MIENTDLKNSLWCSKPEYEELLERNQEENSVTYHSVNMFPHILIHYLVLITQFP